MRKRSANMSQREDQNISKAKSFHWEHFFNAAMGKSKENIFLHFFLVSVVKLFFSFLLFFLSFFFYSFLLFFWLGLFVNEIKVELIHVIPYGKKIIAEKINVEQKNVNWIPKKS